jgi:signal transduction histidine kinase
MKGSLRNRIGWTMWVLAALVCLLTVLTSTFVFIGNVDETAKRRIRAEQANLVALGLVDLISLNGFREIVTRLPETLQADRLNEVLRIYSPTGQLLYRNLKQPDFDRLKVNRAKFVNKDFYLIHGESQDYLALLRSHRTFARETLWVEIATPRRKTTDILADLALPLLAFLAFLLLASYGLATYLTQWGLRPLLKVSGQIDRLDLTSLKTWEPLSATNQPVEFRLVLQKLDQLLRRTQSLLLRSQRMAQFVAHEVRTPLTILRGEMESALAHPSTEKADNEALFRSALEEVERIETTVQRVLKFGRAREREHLWLPQAIDLRKLVSDLLHRYFLWAQRTIELKVPSGSLPPVYADPELIELLLGNLIRNISEHTPPGTSASLSIESSVANEVNIIVSDSGPGLPPDILASAQEEAGGDGRLGVGLTLCREIASVGRISLKFENRNPSGLTITVTLPLVS